MNRTQRNLILFFAALFLAGCVTAPPKADFSQRVDFSPGMAGFRKFKWGMGVEEAGDQLVSQGFDAARNIESFIKKADDLTIGEAHLEGVNYVFYNNQLDAITIIAKGEENYKALREYMQKNLGEITPENASGFTYDLEHTALFCTYNSESETTLMFIRRKTY